MVREKVEIVVGAVVPVPHTTSIQGKWSLVLSAKALVRAQTLVIGAKAKVTTKSSGHMDPQLYN